MKKQLSATMGLLIVMIGIGTVLFRSLEDWTWVQSFYFTVVTLTTVGYGDLAPSSDVSRLATALFILVGVAIVVSALSIVGNMVHSKSRRRK